MAKPRWKQWVSTQLVLQSLFFIMVWARICRNSQYLPSSHAPVWFKKIVKHLKKIWKILWTNIYKCRHRCKLSWWNDIFSLWKIIKPVVEMRFQKYFWEHWFCYFCTGHHKGHFMTKFCTYVDISYMFVDKNSELFEMFNYLFLVFLIGQEHLSSGAKTPPSCIWP